MTEILINHSLMDLAVFAAHGQEATSAYGGILVKSLAESRISGLVLFSQLHIGG